MGMFLSLTLEMKDGESRFFVERKYTVIGYKKVS